MHIAIAWSSRLPNPDIGLVQEVVHVRAGRSRTGASGRLVHGDVEILDRPRLRVLLRDHTGQPPVADPRRQPQQGIVLGDGDSCRERLLLVLSSDRIRGHLEGAGWDRAQQPDQQHTRPHAFEP